MGRFKTILKIIPILMTFSAGPVFGWSWNSADNVLPSLREDLDKEIEAYRARVGNGMTLHERIIALDRIIGNYKPLGLSVVELETEQNRLLLQEKQQQLRSFEAQDEATALYDKAVAEFREGEYQHALSSIREAERQLPEDEAIKTIRMKLEGIIPILESERGTSAAGKIIQLSLTRFLENDPRRAMNAIIYVEERETGRPEIGRVQALIQKFHPEFQMEKRSAGISLVEYKLQSALEAIYDGRYLTAIANCSDVLDLEPENILALTRLGSAYFAMNERSRARQIWTKALQLDPNNTVLRKFLYSAKGGNKIETR